MSSFYYILTLGCQMNKNDSERLAGLLNSMGLASTDNPAQADLLLLNTCSVRQSAEDRVYGIIKNWQALRKRKSNLIIGITGCMPGRDKDGKLKNKIKGVDLFFSTEEMRLLPRWIQELNPELISQPREIKDYLTIAPQRQSNFQAFVTIQTGCNNFCAYCVVPHARGCEKNRPVKEILKEVKMAVKKGAVEITLLGQVVNNYHASDEDNFSSANPFKDADDFAALLWEINQIEGVERINWTATDPQYFSDAQIEALKLPRQVNYLHLPVQSGDNEILKKMNRKYTREYYINLIDKIRAVKPDIAIGTDIIVGFCGETEEQFNSTIDLYKKCDFDISYTAMYSQRSGTMAAKAFKDDVSHVEKKRRWRALQNMMEEITFRKNQQFLNQTISVLVESCEDGICEGSSREMKLVQFPGDANLVGKVAEVLVCQPEQWILKGKLKDG